MPIDARAFTTADLQTGRISAADMTEACLERIACDNPALNAIIVHNPAALDEARAIDRRRAAGDTIGPLAGVPIVVKDTMDMAGLPTTAGWSLLKDRLLPAIDAPVVSRMRAAGAVILGKTNVPVLSASGSHANDSWAGPTINAVAPDFMPGGSSAGSATAVASGMAILGLAEETGGSIQNPASAQGLVGIKPTFGLVPNTGVVPLSSLRDVVGPIARTVRDAALCLDALADRAPEGGYGSRLHADALSGRRLGLYGPGWRDQELSDEAAELYTTACRQLEQCGAVLIEDPFRGSDFVAIRKPISPRIDFDARGLESLPNDIERYLHRLGPEAPLRSFADFAAATASQNPFAPAGVLAFMAAIPLFAECLADPSRPPDMSEFIAARNAYVASFDDVMSRHRLDALAFPQMRRQLPPLHGPGSIEETTVDEINIAGLPGVTVPANRYASGAPFGLIFVGRQWSEADLLALAFGWEARQPA